MYSLKGLMTLLGVSGFLLFYSSVSLAFTRAELHSPTGYWLTVDDKTNQPRSVVYITNKVVSGRNTLVGHLVVGLYIPGYKWRMHCSRCVAPYTNKPLVGMKILWGFYSLGSQWNSTWTNGQLFDVDSNNNIYRGKLWLENGGKTMQVRGYAFMFFRTQTWQRLSSVQVKHYQALMQQQLKAHPVSQ